MSNSRSKLIIYLYTVLKINLYNIYFNYFKNMLLNYLFSSTLEM